MYVILLIFLMMYISIVQLLNLLVQPRYLYYVHQHLVARQRLVVIRHLVERRRLMWMLPYQMV